MADEPTSALDVVVQRQVMVTLGRLQEGLEAAVILVGHDMGLVAQFADTVGVMYAGKLVEVGPVEQIFEEPLHPYTRLLIESLPNLREKREAAGRHSGLPPLSSTFLQGVFSTPLPLRHGPLHPDLAGLRRSAAGAQLACHLYQEPGVSS